MSLLSFGCKITLLKSVLCSIPIHVLAVINIPKGFLAKLDQIFENFLWTGRFKAPLDFLAYCVSSYFRRGFGY